MEKLSLVRKIVLIGGLALTGSSLVEGRANCLRNIEGDGIDPTRSAVARVLGVDAQDQCYRELYNCATGNDINLPLHGTCSDWECDTREVADLNAADPQHQTWHTPDTLKEKVAALASNPVNFIAGLALALGAIIKRKAKINPNE